MGYIIWGSCYNIPRATFCLLEGDYRVLAWRLLDENGVV